MTLKVQSESHRMAHYLEASCILQISTSPEQKTVDKKFGKQCQI